MAARSSRNLCDRDSFGVTGAVETLCGFSVSGQRMEDEVRVLDDDAQILMSEGMAEEGVSSSGGGPSGRASVMSGKP
jgi:hypothetical protein